MLKRLYYNLKEPTAFSSSGPLQKASKKSIKTVQQFLENQPVYSRHKQVRYKFPRRQTKGLYVFSHVQADLIDLSSFSRQNKGYRYCLSMIDCFSRLAFTIPLYRKTGKEVATALEHIFERLQLFPAFLVSDRGKEFVNSSVKEYLSSRFINLIHPNSDIKCAMVERFNRTWETRLFKYLTANKTKKWIDVAAKLTSAINNSYHRIIKCTPQEVFSGEKKPAETTEIPSKQPKYRVGEMVRLSHQNKAFRRGYESGWTDEVFQIVQSLSGSPPTYRIVDSDGEEISGIVYEQELVRAV